MPVPFHTSIFLHSFCSSSPTTDMPSRKEIGHDSVVINPDHWGCQLQDESIFEGSFFATDLRVYMSLRFLVFRHLLEKKK